MSKTITQLKITYNTIITLIIIVLIILIGNLCYSAYHQKTYPFVAGKTGTKCYSTSFEHKNIKYHVFFKTLKECEEYVKRNK